MKRPTKKALVYILLCTVFTSLGQLLIKLGVDSLRLTPIGLLTNYSLMAGLSLYALGAIVLIYALKYTELSLAYPLISLSFIWVSILSMLVLHEPMSMLQWIGNIFIIGGVSMVVSADG